MKTDNTNEQRAKEMALHYLENNIGSVWHDFRLGGFSEDEVTEIVAAYLRLIEFIKQI